MKDPIVITLLSILVISVLIKLRLVYNYNKEHRYKEVTMTKEQAIKALRKGELIRHTSFAMGDYILLKGDNIEIYEFDVHIMTMTFNDFWQPRIHSNWERGYSIVLPN